MHGQGGVGCDFCDLDSFRDAEVLIESDLSFFAAAAVDSQATLASSGVICPRAHRESPFELTAEEWMDTRGLLLQAKASIYERLRPDGYNVFWNVAADAGQEVAHVHLHVIPRFHDEPLAGRGARWLLKQPENRRPDPSAQGLGRAVPRRRS